MNRLIHIHKKINGFNNPTEFPLYVEKFMIMT